MAIRHYLNIMGDSTPWYGICLAVGVVSMAICLYHTLRKGGLKGEDETRFLLAFPLMLGCGVVASVILDAFFTGDWRTWLGAERRVGFTFTGFLVGAIIGLSVYGRSSGLGCRPLLNSLLPPLALAQGFGRIGCFLGGCCYGVPCLFGVAYPPGSYPHSIVGDIPLFPIQLVEAALLFGLFGIALLSTSARRMYVYVIGASVIRFFVEFLRYDRRGTLFGIDSLSPQQLLSLGLAAVFVALLVRDEWHRKFDG